MYMQSNQPYNRVEEDSVWSGAAIGAGIGGAAAGATHMWGEKGFNAINEKGRKRASSKTNGKMEEALKNNANASVKKELTKESNGINHKYNNRKDSFSKNHNKAFGSGTSKGLAYGASILAGGLTGGIIDSINN